eukprot:scaffold88272_cov57-Attheya_sp.AAC.6
MIVKKSLLLAVVVVLVVEAFASGEKEDHADDGFSRLVAWMKLHGGRVDERIDVAEIHGIRGVVALDTIEDGAELLHCPWKLVIGSTGLPAHMQMQSSDDMCQVVHDMAKEIRLSSQSLWWPYLEHIEIPRLSAMWGPLALDELQGLSPSEDATRHFQWFSQYCAGNNNNNNDNKEDQHATVAGMDQEDSLMRSLVSFVSRASEVGMVPIYDLLNHHNGRKNAKLSLTEEGVHLRVVGGSAIQKGQELFLSYGVKSAPVMYRDYGFVEEWPCCWNWKDVASGDNFAFVLFPDDVVAINPTKEFLQQIWHSSSSVPVPVHDVHDVESTTMHTMHNVDMRLAEFQSSAKRHMESLSLEELDRFARAARIHLDGLPTTLQQDQAILEGERESFAQAMGDDDDDDDLEDVIRAIEYRSTFKMALLSALNSSEAAAQIMRETQYSRYGEF